jgi:hypothetical protein
MIKIAIFGLLFASCANAAGTDSLSLKLTELAPGTKAGGKILVRITITNESDHEITYHNTNSCNYSFKVLTSAGIPVSETEMAKALNCGDKIDMEISGRNIVVTLNPGESSSEDRLVTELYDMTLPGDYSVQVDRTFPGIGHFISNIVKVTVTELPAESKPIAEIEPAEENIPPADEPSSETTKQPFSIKINAGHSHVKVGDPVYVDIEMRNTSDHEIDCTAMTGNNGIDRNFQYEILDDNGDPAPKIAAGKTFPEAIPCTLKPENNYSTGGEISRIFDFSRPGKYTIQLSRPIWGNDQIPETGRTVQNGQTVVKSNKITITVLPADDQPTQAPAPK